MTILELMNRGATKKAIIKRIQSEDGIPLIIETLGFIESILARSNGRARIGQLSPVDIVVIMRTLSLRKDHLNRARSRKGKRSQKELHSNPESTKRLSRGKSNKESNGKKEIKPKKRTTRRKTESE